MSIHCPTCNAPSLCIDSRPHGSWTRRRLTCSAGHRFSTIEITVPEYLVDRRGKRTLREMYEEMLREQGAPREHARRAPPEPTEPPTAPEPGDAEGRPAFERFAFLHDFDTTLSQCGGRTGQYASEATARAWQVWMHFHRQRNEPPCT